MASRFDQLIGTPPSFIVERRHYGSPGRHYGALASGRHYGRTFRPLLRYNFMRMNYPSCYLTADAILIVGNEVLLVQRGHDPFQGKWALPGGFVEENEKVLDGAKRELQEETGIENISLTQFGAYGDPGRDPRGRVVCVVYWSFLEKKPAATAADDAAECGWFDLNQLPELAFDHEQILADVRNRLKLMRG